MSSSLFEVYLEIGKVQSDAEKVILSCIPENYGEKDPGEANILKRLQEFSFSAPNPIINDADNRRFAAVQYTYVLQECVNIKSGDCDITTLSHYVFCLQRDDGLVTHCISSLNPFFRSFYKLLSIISTANKDGKEASIERLLETLLNEGRIPTRGNPVAVYLPPSYGLPNVSIEYESPFCLPLMYESEHIAEFYRAFGLLQSNENAIRRNASTIVKIFSHLLMERRFLVTSNEVRRFTNCCYALQTILCPLEWNYTFVPLLFPDPRIIDMVGLPQPYIMGIHKSHLSEALKIADSPEDCTIVLDVDTGRISTHYPDDHKVLPKEVRNLMESRLSNTEMISRKSDYFCRIFLDALVLLIGDYSQFFVPNATIGVEFSWSKYQQYRPETDYKRFAMDAEYKLGMIKQFILMRLETVRKKGTVPVDDFELSLKNRHLLVKECRGNVQHRIKHSAGKLVGTARDGIKWLKGTSLVPPRSQSRPILEQSSGVPSEMIRRPLSQEDLSFRNEHALADEVRSSVPTAPRAAEQQPQPQWSPVAATTSKPPPRVEVLPAASFDLIRLGDDSDDAELAEIDLEKADPLTLFDPLEKPLSKRASWASNTSSDGSATQAAKSRSSSLLSAQQQQQQRKSGQQTQELIDRVLALYSVSNPQQQQQQLNNSRNSSSSGTNLQQTWPFPNSQTPAVATAATLPVAPMFVGQTLANARNQSSRQSMLFPGRIPVSFQRPAVAFQQQLSQQHPPCSNKSPVNFFPSATNTTTPTSSFACASSTTPPGCDNNASSSFKPTTTTTTTVLDKPAHWTKFD